MNRDIPNNQSAQERWRICYNTFALDQKADKKSKLYLFQPTLNQNMCLAICTHIGYSNHVENNALQFIQYVSLCGNQTMGELVQTKKWYTGRSRTSKSLQRVFDFKDIYIYIYIFLFLILYFLSFRLCLVLVSNTIYRIW